MSSVRVRFILGRGFISWAIARVTGSQFSHVEFGTPEGTWIGAHASGGVQERPADYCKPVREYVYEIPCNGFEEYRALTWMRAKIGTKYNIPDIIGLLFQVRALTSPNRLICSEFCALGLLSFFGAHRVLNVQDGWAYRVTPETLHLSPIFVGNLVKKVG